MAGHEARINDALRQLGEEFRLGMVAEDEYRSRRRLLLESWGELDATTSPGMRGVGSVTTDRTPRPGTPKAPPPPPSPAARGGKLGLVAVIAAVVAVGLAVLYVATAPKPGAPAVTTATPAAPEASPQVQAIKQAADGFLARNSWDAAPIDAFLAQWRQLSPGDRARALEEPSLRTLRYELQQNIHAEAQLVPADAPPEQRERLDRLTRFDQELAGG